MNAPLHTLGLHANHMAKHVNSERQQTILNYLGIGSIVVMGLAAVVQLFRGSTCKMEPHQHQNYHRLKDDLDKHYRSKNHER